jgi:hypothetical protein
MTKGTGLGDNFYVGGYDLSGDTQSLGRIGGGAELMETTGIDKSGIERLGGTRSGGFDFESYFNDAAAQAHVALAPLPRTDVIMSYYRGTTQGNRAANLVAKQINYDPTRGNDGSLTYSVTAESNGYGIEWGRMLTAGKQTDSSAGNGTGFQDPPGASTLFGLQAYLHVFAFTGTSVVVKLQESQDNASGDAYADVTGGAFASVNGAHVTQRIATANNLTVEEWLRVVTTGTFSNFVFAVAVVRNQIAGQVF